MAEPTASAGPPAWRRSRPPGRPGIAFRLAATGALVLAGLVFWLAHFFRPPPTNVFVVVEADYTNNLAVPLNPYAPLVGADLAELAKDARAELREFPNFQSEHTATLLAALKEEHKRQSLIVFVALHGAADVDRTSGRKTAYLLAGDAGEEGVTSGRVPLAELIDTLGQSSARHKLLVLDATGFTAAAPLGVLRNDFAEALNELDAKVRAVSGLVVFAASGPQQRSWAAPDYQRSAFAQFVFQGLAGAADEDKNSRVTAWEVFEYARQQTAAYAARHYAAEQTPVLLPAGDEGRRRAEALDIGHVRADRRSAPRLLSPADADKLHADLIKEWDTFHTLIDPDRGPPPTAYAPEVWQEYRALLRRAGQLYLAGLPNRMGLLTDRLERLRTELRERQHIYLPLAASMSCPAVAVTRPLVSIESGDPVIDLVRKRKPAFDPDRFAELASQQLQKLSTADRPARDSDRHEKVVRPQDWLRVVRLALLERAAEDVQELPGDAAQALRPAAAYARILMEQVGLTVQPPEVNFLGVLARDLPAGGGAGWREMVAQAIRLRLLAERAAVGLGDERGVPLSSHAYSERVTPWTADAVREGDRHRRLFEDRLFGEPAAADDPDRTAARAAYDRALDQAAKVREAIVEYDHSAADLHGYARWAALVSPADKLPRAQQDVLRKVDRFSRLISDLGSSLHLRGGAAADSVKALGEARQAVEHAREELENIYSGDVKAVIALPPPDFWAAAESVLANAPVPVKPEKREAGRNDRAALWEVWMRNVRNMEHVKNVPQVPRPERDAGAAARPDDGASARQAGAAGAIVRLTRDLLRDQNANAAMNPDRNTLVARLNGPDGATHGPDLAQFWDDLRSKVVALCKYGMTAGGPADPDDARAQAVAAAADLSRALDGTTNHLLYYADPETRRLVTVHPADAYRRWQVRRLLDRQAGRAIEDQWYDDAPRPRPFFRRSAAVYLDERLPLSRHVRDGGWRSALGDRLAGLLGERDDFSLRFVRPGTVLGITDEVAVAAAVDYRLPVSPPDAAGSVAYWAEVPAGRDVVVLPRRLEALPPPNTPPGPEVVFGGPSQPQRLPDITLRPADVGNAAAASRVILRGRFRGRVLEQANELALSVEPDVIVTHQPPPPTARIAVRAAADVRAAFGGLPGAVAVVLDCSGSMAARAGEGRSKYAVAVEALENVLDGLPEGTALSVSVFGAQALDERPPTEQDDPVRTVRPPSAWKKGESSELVAKLRNLQPTYESPVAYAAIRAKAELAADRGYAAVILLTDGVDNRWGRGPNAATQKGSVAEALRAAFDGTDVRLDVIAFSVPKAEADGVQQQFRVTETFNPPGRFVNVADVFKLLAPLRQAILARRQIRYLLRSATDPAVAHELTAGEFGLGDGWSPPLRPGEYHVWAGSPAGRLATALVRPGDNLLLRLSAPGGRLRIEREPVTDRAPAGRNPGRPAGSDGWRFTTAGNDLEGDRLLLTPLLERLPSAADPRPEVVRPDRVWFEVASTPAAVGRPLSVRWKPDHARPTPAWNVEVSSWPPPVAGPPRPKLKVWWGDAAGEPFEAFRPGESRKLPAGEVTVEQPTFGKDQAGRTMDVTVLCPRGQAFWVRPADPGWVLVDHRFYRGLGRVIARFRTDSHDRLEPTRFELASVEQFKAKADAAGSSLELSDLDEPTVRFTGPASPAAPKRGKP